MDILRTFIYTAMAAACLSVISCDRDRPDPDKGIDYKFTTLRIDGTETRSDSLWFTAGSSGKLAIDEMKDAVWTASDPSTVTIGKDGSLTAIKAGKAAVYATEGARTVHYGVVVPDFSQNIFDIKGADFQMYTVNVPELGQLTLSKTSVKAYVWNAVLEMEDHFYSTDYWNVTPGWSPKVTGENVGLFIARLNACTGVSFRLPLKAEWEAVTKAGLTKDRAYTAESGDEGEAIWLIKD